MPDVELDPQSIILALSTPPPDSFDAMIERFNDVLGPGMWTMRHDGSWLDGGKYTCFVYVSIHPGAAHGVTGYGESKRSREAAYRNAVRQALYILGIIGQDGQEEPRPVQAQQPDVLYEVQPDSDDELHSIAAELCRAEAGKVKNCACGQMKLIVRRIQKSNSPKFGMPCAYYECPTKNKQHQTLWIQDSTMAWAVANAVPATAV